MSSQKDKGQKKKKVLYSEDFQAMLEKLEEEDNEDTSKQMMKKSRLCLDKVKALEKHFEMENRLQPERKVKIAEEVGLEPRQVAIWFQNRRARWRTKQLEKEYDDLRANYDALKHDYGSLEQEKVALLAQLKDLKAKIKLRNSNHDMNTSPSVPAATVNSSNITHESSSMDVPSSCTSLDPFAMSMDGLQLCRAYQDHLMRMQEMGVVHNINEISGNNFFSIDQAPTMHHWYNNDQLNW